MKREKKGKLSSATLLAANFNYNSSNSSVESYQHDAANLETSKGNDLDGNNGKCLSENVVRDPVLRVQINGANDSAHNGATQVYKRELNLICIA